MKMPVSCTGRDKSNSKRAATPQPAVVDRPPTRLPKSTCAICLESLFLPNQHIGCITPCGHCFHLDCVRQWKAEKIGGRRASRCPLCNRLIDRCGKIYLHLTEGDNAGSDEETVVSGNHDESNSSNTFDRAEAERRTSELIAKLVYQVMWSTDAKAVLEALELLSNLAEDGYRACKSIALAGGIPAAVRAVRNFSRAARPTISIQASVLLGDLCRQDKSGRLQMSIVRAGAIQAIVLLIKQTINDHKSLTIIFWTLATLADQKDDGIAKGADMRSAVVAQGQQIRVILAVMKLHPNCSRLQAHACKALFNLIYCPAVSDSGEKDRGSGDPNLLESSNEGVTVAVNASAIPTILEAMSNCRNDADVQTNSCCLLFKLCRDSPVNAQSVLSEGGISLVVKAMKQYPKDTAVQHAACCLLWSIHEYCSEGTKDALQISGGYKALARARKTHIESRAG